MGLAESRGPPRCGRRATAAARGALQARVEAGETAARGDRGRLHQAAHYVPFFQKLQQQASRRHWLIDHDLIEATLRNWAPNRRLKRTIWWPERAAQACAGCPPCRPRRPVHCHDLVVRFQSHGLPACVSQHRSPGDVLSQQHKGLRDRQPIEQRLNASWRL